MSSTAATAATAAAAAAVLAEFKLSGGFDQAREEALALLAADNTFTLCDTETRRQVDTFLAKEASITTPEFTLTQQLQRFINSNTRLNNGISQCVGHLFQHKHEAFASKLRGDIMSVLEAVEARQAAAAAAVAAETAKPVAEAARLPVAQPDAAGKIPALVALAPLATPLAVAALPKITGPGPTTTKPPLLAATRPSAAPSAPAIVATAAAPAILKVPEVPQPAPPPPPPLAVAAAAVSDDELDNVSDVSSVHTSDLSSLEDNDEGQPTVSSKKATAGSKNKKNPGGAAISKSGRTLKRKREHSDASDHAVVSKKKKV